MTKKDKDAKTERLDLLIVILQELREMRKERAQRDEALDQRIEKVEADIRDIKRDLTLVSNELQNQGVSIEGLRLQCRRRLEICHGDNCPCDAPPIAVVSSSGSK